MPHIVANKVPYETCELVPSVKCHLVLKKVAELQCVPDVDKECNDFAKEIPYLVQEEECEEVVYDDCFEVSLFGYKYSSLPRLRNKYLCSYVSEQGLMTRQFSFREDKSSGRRGRSEERRQVKC